MKRVILILVFLLALIVWVKAQNNGVNCKQFLDGKYVYKEQPFERVKVKRTKKYQYEYNPKNGLRLKFRIKWGNDCDYTLTYLKVSKKEFDKLLGEKIYVKIDTIIDETTYEYTANLKGSITNYTMIKVK